MKENLKANLALVGGHPLLALFLLGLLAVSIVYVLLFVGVKHKLLAEPVRITMKSTHPRDLDSINVYAAKPRGDVDVIPRSAKDWLAHETFFKTIKLAIPNSAVPNIERIVVHLGRRDFEFEGHECLSSWTKSGGDSAVTIYDSPRQVRLEGSSIPFISTIINWPGDAFVLSKTALRGLSVLLLCLCLIAVTLPFVNWSTGRANLKTVVLLCLLFITVYSVYYLSSTHFDDTVFFGGDQWEYQSMAVNFAKGHGLQLIGGMEPFEAYRFGDYFYNPQLYPKFVGLKSGSYRVYRSPGYPLILGLVYKVFGVIPERARQVQLFMFIIVAGLLPLVGYAYWNLHGFYGGMISGALFLECYWFIATSIMTEPLITLLLFLLVLLFLAYERKRSLPASIALGVGLGIALLVKGDLIFIPPLFVAALLYQAWKKRGESLHAVMLALCCVMTVAPWSIYASLQSQQFVFVSTQGKTVLVEGNNEGTFDDGGWHPEKLSRPGSYMNSSDIKDLPVPLKLVRFYAHYADRIPLAIANKLHAGFEEFLFIKAAILLVAASTLKKFVPEWRKRLGSRNRWVWYAAIVPAGLAFLLCLSSFTATLLVSLVLVGLARVFGKHLSFTLPQSFALIFLNFFLITILVFGEPRFISVIDFLGILVTLSVGLGFCLPHSSSGVPPDAAG